MAAIYRYPALPHGHGLYASKSAVTLPRRKKTQFDRQRDAQHVAVGGGRIYPVPEGEWHRGWDPARLIGLDDLYRKLEKKIVRPMNRYVTKTITSRAFLLVGVKNSRKKELIWALSATLNGSVRRISPEEVGDLAWQGRIAHILGVFQGAILSPQPVVILFEDIDKIANDRAIQRAIAVQIHNLKRCPGGFRGQGVFVVATCSRVTELHSDLVDQIDKAYYVPVLTPYKAWELVERLWHNPQPVNWMEFRNRITFPVYGWCYKDIKAFIRDYQEVLTWAPIALWDLPLEYQRNPRLRELSEEARNRWRTLVEQHGNDVWLREWSKNLFRRRAHRDWVDRHAGDQVDRVHRYGGQAYWPLQPIYI